MNTATLHRTHTGRRVVVNFVYPPIPLRGFDYCATFEGYEPGEPQGFGRTREEAIGQLIEQAYPEESE